MINFGFAITCLFHDNTCMIFTIPFSFSTISRKKSLN